MIVNSIRFKSDEIRSIFVLLILRGKVTYFRIKFRLIYQRSILAFLFDRILEFRWLIKSRVGRSRTNVSSWRKRREKEGEEVWRFLRVIKSLVRLTSRFRRVGLPLLFFPSLLALDLAHGLTDNNAVFYCTITLKRADKTTLYRVEKKEKK